jgi:aspartate aminotransferase
MNKKVVLKLRDFKISGSATLGINEQVSKLLKKGQKIYHLGLGENRFPLYKPMIAGLKKNAFKKAYLPVKGHQAIRKAIASYYKNKSFNFSYKQMMVGPGSKSLLYACIHQLKGDVLLPVPSWVSYGAQAIFSSKKVYWIKTKERNDYVPTAEEIQKALLKARKKGMNPGIIIINSPNNPTGVTYTAKQCHDIAEVCRKNELTIISDEIYSQVGHTKRKYHSIAKDYPEGTIITDGLSKIAAAGGWRLGWAVFPDTDNGKKVLKSVSDLASQVWSCCSAPIEYAALAILKNSNQVKKYTSDMAQLLAERTKYLYKELSKIGITAPKPSGGFYLFVNFNKYKKNLSQKGIKTSIDLQRYFLEKHSLAALSGSCFGDNPDNLTLRLATSYFDCCCEKSACKLFDNWQKQDRKTRAILADNHPELFEIVKIFKNFIKNLNS